MFNVQKVSLEKTRFPEFIQLCDRLLEQNILDIDTKQVYQHRLAMNVTPIEYIAIVGIKKAQRPENLLSR